MGDDRRGGAWRGEEKTCERGDGKKKDKKRDEKTRDKVKRRHDKSGSEDKR